MIILTNVIECMVVGVNHRKRNNGFLAKGGNSRIQNNRFRINSKAKADRN